MVKLEDKFVMLESEWRKKGKKMNQNCLEGTSKDEYLYYSLLEKGFLTHRKNYT